MNVTDNAYLAENVVVPDKTLGFRQAPKEELLTLKNLAKIYRISPDLLHCHLNHRPEQ